MILKATVTVHAYKDDSFKTTLGLPISKTIVMDTDNPDSLKDVETLSNSVTLKTIQSVNTECLLNNNKGETS